MLALHTNYLYTIHLCKRISIMSFIRNALARYLSPFFHSLTSVRYKPHISDTDTSSLVIGVIVDLHHDVMHDGTQRLTTFLEACAIRKPNFIIQLGDFCHPLYRNRSLLDLWQQFSGKRYHVLGNHDMDVASKKETMDWLGMQHNYYSFDFYPYHFVVLDANYLYQNGQFTDYEKANFYRDDQYKTFIHPDQIDWLAADLSATTLPTIIFSHQSLVHERWGVKNRMHIQHILEAENRSAGYPKVLACVNGHNHLDFHRVLNGIHYIDINSASYFWLGESYTYTTQHPKAIHARYPYLKYVASYQAPLFTFLTLGANGTIQIEGRQTTWVGLSPQERGLPTKVLGSRPSPTITARTLSYDSPNHSLYEVST